MKKKTFQIVILLLLNIIFIGTANALDMKQIGSIGEDITNDNVEGGYGNVYTNVNFKNSWTIRYDLNNKNNKYNVEGYDYLQFGFLIQYDLNETYNETTHDYKPEENGEVNCITWDMKNQTYADGTRSSYYVCTKWELVNQSSLYTTSTNGTLKNTPNIGINIELIFDDGTLSPCEINTINYGNSYVTCKIPNNAKVLNTIRFRNMGTFDKSNDINGRIGMAISYVIWKDPVNTLKEQQQKTNDKIDDIKNSDITNESKEAPNTNEFNDYQKAENGLFDKMKQADTNNLDVAIDGNSANFVWDTITRFYNSNALLMNFLISILSIGIIKMALGR